MRAASDTTPEFRSEPLVVGALGSVDAALLGRLVESQPGLTVRVRRPRFVIASDPEVEHWSNGLAEGWYWNALNPGVRPGSWQEAQRASMSSGVAVDGDRVILHNDRFGMQQLFFFEHGGGVYFSNWLPLLAAVAPTLSVDPLAWASILSLGFPLPGSSPFAEIRSLAHGSALVAEPGNIETVAGESAGWIARATEWDGALGDVVEELRRGIPASSRHRAVTLSGGWDSRLLLGLAASNGNGRRFEAWTTSPGDDSDRDLELARPVARHFDVEHLEVLPDADSWAASSAVAMRRFNHQTWMHAWLEPLAASMWPSGVGVIDGLAGAVLFKGLYQDPADDACGHSVRARRDLWLRLGGKRSVRDDVWSPESLALFEEVAFSSFDAYIAPMIDHPTWQMTAVMTTRTARAIALSPLRLFAPELPVQLPFLAPNIVGAAYSASMYPRRSSDQFLELLAEVDPLLAALPSTNDATATAFSIAHRQEHPVAIQRFVDVIGAVEPALRLLAPALRDAIQRADVGAIARAVAWDGPRTGLQAAYLFADWHRSYPALRGDLL